jgi:phosphohistidine phosphatase
VQYTRDFYHGYTDTFIDILGALDDKYEQVMIVGHNPGLEELLEVLTGDYERMPTAALAQVLLPIHSWADLGEEPQGELVAFWRPKELYL